MLTYKSTTPKELFILFSSKFGKTSLTLRGLAGEADTTQQGSLAWFQEEIRDHVLIYELRDVDLTKENYTTEDVKRVFKKARKYKWLLDEWNVENPANNLDTTEDLIQLSSRFKKIGKWYENANEKWASINSRPEWLTEIDSDNSIMWNQTIREKLELMSEANRVRVKEIQNLARERKSKINRIDEKFMEQVKEIVKVCPEVGIEMLTLDSMPISDQLKIYRIIGSEEQKNEINRIVKEFKKDKYTKLREGSINAENIISLLMEKL